MPAWWARQPKLHTTQHDFEISASTRPESHFNDLSLRWFWYFILSKGKEKYFENHISIDFVVWKRYWWTKWKNKKHDISYGFYLKFENKAKCSKSMLFHGAQWQPSKKYREFRNRRFWKLNINWKYLKYGQFEKPICKSQRGKNLHGFWMFSKNRTVQVERYQPSSGKLRKTGFS